MKHTNDEGCETGALPVVYGPGNSDFRQKVLEKLARLETMMAMIVGNGQPGRLQLAEKRLETLERNDLRRTVYDRIVIAGITFAITFAISAIVGWRELLGWK